MDEESCAHQVYCSCSVEKGLTTAICFATAFTALFGLSRLLTPLAFPNTAAALRKKPGQLSYWDSSVVSCLNGAVNAALVVLAVQNEPALLMSPDGFLKTADTCRVAVIFLTWCSWELVLQLLHWGHWEGRIGMLVHHGCAIAAWALYLQGGYGHALSLVGVFCEVTNPFMNLRWLLSSLGLKGSWLYVINGVLFCLSWLLVRVLFALPAGTYLLLIQWQTLQPLLPTWRLVLLVGFFAVGLTLNLFWGIKLLRGAQQILRGSGHPKEDSRHARASHEQPLLDQRK